MNDSGRIWVFAAALAIVAGFAGLISACDPPTFPDGSRTFYPVCRAVDVHKSPGAGKITTVKPHTVEVVARSEGWTQLSTTSYAPGGDPVTRTGWIEERDLRSDKFGRVDADTYKVCRFGVGVREDKEDSTFKIGLPVMNLELVEPIEAKEINGNRWWRVRAVSDAPTITGWVPETIFL
jgi:hypothetical protein